MIYDCFISYQHDDFDFVRAIVDELEARKLTCWYAPRDVKGRYARAIADGISGSKVFLLILNKRSAVSEAVLNEIEMAHNVSKTSGYSIIQPVCTEVMEFDSPAYREIMYYVRRYHFVDATDMKNISKIADDIINSQSHLLSKVSDREKSGYVSQNIEDERLKIQNELLDSFDKDIYDGIFGGYQAPHVLDVGCGTGDMIVRKLGERDYTLVGVDKSDRQISFARKLYESACRAFVIADVESYDFDDCISEASRRIQCDRFDVINVSMLLLHVKDTVSALKRLKKYLSDDGTIIIRDIDDGINFAYPDCDNAFERIYRMCDRDEQSGNRRTGRSVYHNLISAGYSDVRLERQGLSSAGMDQEQKEQLFRMYFPFILENSKIMSEKNAWNAEYREDYQWYEENFELLHSEFMKPDFIFSLGFQIYTAKA